MISFKSTIFQSVLIAVTLVCLINVTLAKSPTSTSSTSSSASSASTKNNVQANSTANRARGSRSGFDPNYSIWGHANPSTLSSSTGRFDMVPLIPIVLLFGLGLMLIPFLTSFIAHVLYPSNMHAGRKRRSSEQESQSFFNEMVVNLMKKIDSAVEKYSK